MTRYELDALLGDTQTTDAQREELLRVLQTIEEVHGDPGEPGMTGEIVNGALMLVLGDATLESLSTAWQAARAIERDTRDRVIGAIIVSVERGIPQSHVATSAGVARDMVREAVGSM